MNTEEKIKCYELDFGDTNLISKSKTDILEWIKADMEDLESDNELHYTITCRWLTQEEHENRY